MPYAITLCLDDPAPVARLLAALAGLADDVARLGYAPHVTLGLYDDADDAARLHAVLAGLAGPVALEVAGLGVFPPGVVYAAPCPARALLDLHAACASRHPHFAPGGWMPHVTLSAAVDAAAAMAVLTPVWRPFRAICSRVELVRFAPGGPVAVLATQGL